MPPRIPLWTVFRSLNIQPPQAPPGLLPATPRAFTTTPYCAASGKSKRTRYRDPYAAAQARARKAANLSRQEALTTQRTAALGDPVRGIETPFVRSFDTTTNPVIEGDITKLKEDKLVRSRYFVSAQDVAVQLKKSDVLLSPDPTSDVELGGMSDAEKLKAYEKYQTSLEDHEIRHDIATLAIDRIMSLKNSSARDRKAVNIQRCIETFGRHETDRALPSKAVAQQLGSSQPNEQPRKMERAGPDTGSSEVQIAILTARIRQLADFLETRGKKDKIGKRNLRLLVHKRQKLLQYLKRKERGGPRWQRCVELLGLTPGTYEGEITL